MPLAPAAGPQASPSAGKGPPGGAKMCGEPMARRSSYWEKAISKMFGHVRVLHNGRKLIGNTIFQTSFLGTIPG